VGGRFSAAVGQTGPVTGRFQDAVAARVPGATALGLVLPPAADVVPAARLADPAWTRDVLDRRARRSGATNRRVVATVWWYSASSVLVTPALAGLLTGRPLSAELATTRVALLPGDQPVAAVSTAAAGDPAAELATALAAVVPAVAEAGAMRERPLWAIATDSIANRLLDLGRAVGDVDRATALAGRVAAAIGTPLPAPRYEDVGGVRFTRRASCCLLDRLPGGTTCTSCPHRPPAQRRALLERPAQGRNSIASPNSCQR
jgi:ferric iron reductase protein FhuF